MKPGERLERLASRVARGSLGYGWRGLSSLLGLVVAREVIGILVGVAIMAAMVLGVILLSSGLDWFGRSAWPKASVALPIEAPK